MQASPSLPPASTFRCFKLLEDQLSKLFPSHPAPHSLEEPLVSEASGEGGASGRSWLQRGVLAGLSWLGRKDSPKPWSWSF